MDTYQPRFDVNFWNLDALELSPKHKGDGIVERKIVTNKINDVSRLTVLKLNKEGDNHVIWLRPSARAVEMLDLKTMKITTLLQWDVQNTFIDLTMDQGFLYALARFDEKYYLRRYWVISNGLRPDRNWSLDSDQGLAGAHLKVVTCRGVVKAFISIPGKNQFAIVDLATKQTVRLDVQLPADDGALGSEIDFCIDTRSETLVIADTWHHRIVEVNYHNGEARVICGNGQAGNAREQTPARGAQLNSPSSVAIYRPNEMIPDYHLSKQSQSFLLSDERTKPRTVLVADSGNLRIKKIVELPFLVSQQLRLSDDPFIYTLLGSGTESREKIPVLTVQNRKDLRSYSIPKPFRLLTTRTGELLIYCRSEQTFLVLKPTTSLEKKIINKEASKKDSTNIDISTG